MEEAGCGNRGQVFGGNFQFNRVGGYVTHREDGGVQILRTTAVLVRQRISGGPQEHSEVKTSLGVFREVSTAGGGVPVRAVKVLPRGGTICVAFGGQRPGC